jgi:hypothetical protein
MLFGLVYEAEGSIELGQSNDGQFIPLADAANRLLAAVLTSSPIVGHEEEEEDEEVKAEDTGFLNKGWTSTKGEVFQRLT